MQRKYTDLTKLSWYRIYDIYTRELGYHVTHGWQLSKHSCYERYSLISKRVSRAEIGVMVHTTVRYRHSAKISGATPMFIGTTDCHWSLRQWKAGLHSLSEHFHHYMSFFPWCYIKSGDVGYLLWVWGLNQALALWIRYQNQYITTNMWSCKIFRLIHHVMR